MLPPFFNTFNKVNSTKKMFMLPPLFSTFDKVNSAKKMFMLPPLFNTFNKVNSTKKHSSFLPCLALSKGELYKQDIYPSSFL